MAYTSDVEALPTASVPVTIITGFLGAGKTTLLRHVLASPHGLKIAVIQNELSAAAGLEASTMVGPDGERFERWLELANGCVCCEVRDELAKGIETLMSFKGAFDYVLVETTGMADPGPVAESLWLDAELESPLRLDGVVTVVDAANYARNSGLLEFCRQLGSADVVLLNKLDALQQPAAGGAAVGDGDGSGAAAAGDGGAAGAAGHGAGADGAAADRFAAEAMVADGLAAADAADGAVAADGGLALDEAAAARVARLHAHLRHLNGIAPIVNTCRSVVPLQSILNLHAFGRRPPAALAAGAAPFAFTGQASEAAYGRAAAAAAAVPLVDGACPPCDEDGDERGPRADGAHGAAGAGTASGTASGASVGAPSAGSAARLLSLHRDPAFGAVTLEVAGALDLSRFDALLACLFWEPHTFGADATGAAAPAPAGGLVGAPTAEADESAHAEDASAGSVPCVFRAKGMVDVAGDERMHTLQAVHATYELVPADAWSSQALIHVPRGTRLVFIGRHLPRDALADAVRACRIVAL